MKEKFVNGCMSMILNNNPEISKKDIDKYKYGLEGFYLNTTKLILIFLLAYFLGILKELIILLVLFNIIRFTAFGVHAKRSLDCLISSTLLFIFFPYLCIKITIPLLVKYLLFFPLVLLIGIYAPSDTLKRPLKNKKKRIIYKVSSIIIACIYIIISILLKDNILGNYFIFALIIQIIVILPITYKIFGVPYNNHKNYETNL